MQHAIREMSVPRPFRWILGAGLAALVSSGAAAQQIVDPSAPMGRQPQIGISGGGVPQINITTPEAGVSHNKFKSFDVDSKGVILNNATAAGVSRIGGTVGANPNLLSSGPANVILTEVTGIGASTLAGAVEVFGKRADVILANPNGITCNGCSFLNAARATVATGVPTVSNGNVAVTATAGTLKVGGAGFSARDGDASLIGRHVFLDGTASAFGDLFISGGAQYYDNATGQSRAAPSLSARETPFAVDATALGAMNAGQIRILGNEAGLGVRTHGKLTSKKTGQATAATGNIGIAASGDVSYFDISADGKGAISGSGAVTQYGNVTFGQSVAIATGAFNLIHGRTLSSAEDISISAEGQVLIEGEVSGRNIKITVGKGLTNVGFIMADGTTEIIAGEALDNYRRKLQGYVITYAPELTKYLPLIESYRAQGGKYAEQAEAWVKQYEMRTLVEEYAARGGTISGTTVAGVITGAIRNTGGLITATDGLTLSSGSSILNSYIKLLTLTDGDEAGGKHYEFHEGEVLSGGNLALAAKADIANEASTFAAYGDLSLEAGGAVKNWVTADKYVVTKTEALGASGTYTSVNETTRDEQMALAPGQILSLAGNVAIKAQSYTAVGSDISAGGDIDLVTSGDVRLMQVVEVLTDSTATRRTWNERYCTASAIYCSLLKRYSYRTASSTSTATETEAMVIASNLTGRDITIDANALDAPALKIAAERDLSVTTKQALTVKSGFEIAPAATLVLDANDYTGWESSFTGDAAADYVVEEFYTGDVAEAASIEETSNGTVALSALTRAIGQSAVRSDYVAFADDQAALRSVATLNALGRASPGEGGGAIKAAARIVGAQAWASDTSKTGFGYVSDASIRDGEESFTAALLKTAAAVSVTSPDFMSAMAWRYASDDGLAQVATSPNVVIHAGRDLLLASTAGGLDLRGELWAGRDMALSGRDSVTLAGSIAEDRDLYVTTTAGGVTFAGSLVTGRDLVVDSHGAVRNTSAVTAGQSLTIASRSASIENLSTRTGNTLTPAQLTAGTGGLVLNAATDIVNHGSTVRSAGAMLLTAGRDISNAAFATEYKTVDTYKSSKSCTWYGSCKYREERRYAEAALIRPAELIAGTDLTLSVERDLTSVGGVIRAGGTLDATAGRDITASVAAVELTSINYTSTSKSFLGVKYKGNYGSAEKTSYATARSTFSGGNVNLRAGGDFVAHGATLASSGALSLQVDGAIGILPVQYQTYANIKSGKKGLFSKSSSASATQKTNTQVTSLDTSKDLSIVSTGSDIVIRAGELSSGGDLTIVAEKGQIAFLTAKGVETQQIKTDSSNLVWWKSEDKGYYLERIIHSHLLSGGKLTVTAGNGVVVEYDERTASASDAIRQLAKSPELAWMGELKVRNDVQWRGVEGAYEQWDHKAEGLTQGAAAVIALAVTVATQGTASGFAGAILTGSGGMGLSGVAGSVAGKAISAGFQAIVSRAAVSLVNNKGDLGKVLKELGSSSSIKSVATSMVTAGLVAALPVNVIPAAAQETLGGGSTLTFAQQLQVNLVKGAIGAGVSTAVQGGDLDRALLASLRSAGLSQVLAAVDTTIGDLTDGSGANDLPVTNMLAHALVGGLAAEALGNDFASGAAAGLASAAAANAGMFDGLDSDEIAAVSQLIGGVAAFIAGEGGEGVNAGADIASSAALNNYLTHEEKLAQLQAAEQLAACRNATATCSAATIESLQREVSRLEALDELRDASLLAARSSGNRIECGRWLQASYDAMLSYPAVHGQYATREQYLASLGPNAREVFAGLSSEYQQIDQLRQTVSVVIGQREAAELAVHLRGLGLGAAAGLGKLLKAGKLDGIARAEFDALPEVLGLTAAQRDAAYVEYVLRGAGTVVVDSTGRAVRIGESLGGPGSYEFSKYFPKNATDAEYQLIATGVTKNVEYRVTTDRLASGEKWFDGYDPSTGNLLDGKRYESWPKDDLQFSIDAVREDIANSSKVAAELGRSVEFRVKSDYGLQKMQEILADLNETAKGAGTPQLTNIVIRKYP